MSMIIDVFYKENNGEDNNRKGKKSPIKLIK